MPLGRVPGAGRADRDRLEARCSRRRCSTSPSRARVARRRDATTTTPDRTRRPADLRRRGRRHRRGREGRRAHQGARALDVPARGRRRHRRLRRALRARPAAATATRCSCSSTDGVGTKSLIARLTRPLRHDRHRLSSRCASTTSRSQGAEPLFFLDYISVGKLVPETIDEIVARRRRGLPPGRLRAASAARCRSTPASWSRASSTSSASRSASSSAAEILPRDVRAGDAIIGFASPGLRCNGYSLARRALLDRARPRARRARVAGAHHSLGDELLAPERDLRAGDGASSRRHVDGARVRARHRRRHPRQPRARAPRPLRRRRAPRHVGGAADLRRDPGRRRRVADDEMEHVFNLGLGMLAVVPPRRGVPRRSTPCGRPGTTPGSSARSSTATAASTSTAPGRAA